MVGEIIYSDNFISQLDELAKVLYLQKYFSFIEDVDFYIDKIYYFVNSNISLCQTMHQRNSKDLVKNI
jgi:hypothetical protein